ncbi:MAG: hypothetical protein EBY29_05410 [Planctomycetes bacterium]|nr:hypothetical protein [Planctomycetota bacterium]
MQWCAANQILARTFFNSIAHPLACQAAGKFSRASSAGPPTALAIKFRKPDRVGRRGLSEPREDFSRLPTYSFPALESGLHFSRIRSASLSATSTTIIG